LQAVDPLITGIEPQSKEVEKLQIGVEYVLNSIENIWLKNNYFIVGNEISIADLMAATELEQLSNNNDIIIIMEIILILKPILKESNCALFNK
jgi:hypothetical protein